MIVSKAKKLANILAVREWRNALVRHRVAAGAEHARVLGGMTGLRTIVDIGANRGQFALVARHCFPDARILAFEPLPEPTSTWRAVFAHDARSSVVNAAIGPATGEALIHVSGRDDSSSLLPITEKQDNLFPGTAQVATRTINITRLAKHIAPDLLDRPALLKIDVQGFEMQALSGCEEVLDGFEWAYVECSFVELYEGQAFADEVIAWLRQRGFLLRGIYNLAYDSNQIALQGDFLFGRVPGTENKTH